MELRGRGHLLCTQLYAQLWMWMRDQSIYGKPIIIFLHLALHLPNMKLLSFSRVHCRRRILDNLLNDVGEDGIFDLALLSLRGRSLATDAELEDMALVQLPGIQFLARCLQPGSFSSAVSTVIFTHQVPLHDGVTDGATLTV